MSDTHGFIRLPPDGSGKRVPQTVMLEFAYDTGTTLMKVGDIISFSTSTFTGTVIESDSLVSGELHIRIPDPVPTTIELVGGEDILVNGLKVAQVAAIPSAAPYYFQQNVIAGGENMIHTMNVSRRGAASTTFETGSPNFDAFGRLQVSGSTNLGEYIQAYDELPDVFGNTVTGGASLTYDNNVRGSTLQVGTAAVDSFKRSTHQYHLYQAGKSTVVEMTVASGDTGKANVVRQWGLYDDKNGLIFRQNGNAFEIVLRSYSTGAVVETIIPQNEFSVDRLDGSTSVFNPSDITLNLDSVNIYWVDYQWLGAGRIRYGIVANGERIVMHEIRNANKNPVSYMSTGSLPVSYEIYNEGLTGSISTLKFFCCHVTLEGTFDPDRTKHSDVWASNVTTVQGVGETMIASGRPVELFKGVDNRGELTVQLISGCNMADVPVVIKVYAGTQITGGTWVSHSSESITEINTTGTPVGGHLISSFFVGANGQVNQIEGDPNTTLYRLNNIALSPTITIMASLVTAGTGGNVSVALNWQELRK